MLTPQGAGAKDSNGTAFLFGTLWPVVIGLKCEVQARRYRRSKRNRELLTHFFT
jgi:hypothetical protein